ncbi:hypothetical protein H257_00310 [Aphanomyces astaci]|uniref:DDE Tnp4 domain-containing protein n=1 Tax=Aphanomyces astaci TaxID=112090 RepID=W4HCG5_APHAT|nr:hypothetical protein H257_00310 [Aphanomyces astaci]ETV88818.1 hypothetical protein H257_00310 [Aphanomyces astaci]|eukprot:XP_009821218.1 hypothetical protein H257_00310 [Aphanomyces astaci]
MVLNVNSMLERLHVQSVSDQLYLDESLYGEVVAEENDTLTYSNSVIDKVMEDSGVEGFLPPRQRYDLYPYAKYAADVKFQPSHRPSGRFGEQRHYFSGKHKLYGLKIKASVSPQGQLVDMSPLEPGSVSDLTMFRTRLDVHVAELTKTPTETTVNDNASVLAIHPKKRPANGALDRHDLERDAAVSADHVIVENFFRRVCLLWKISYSTFAWGEKIYDGIQRLTSAWTNFHIGLMPLREDDHHQYRSVLARYARIAE